MFLEVQSSADLLLFSFDSSVAPSMPADGEGVDDLSPTSSALRSVYAYLNAMVSSSVTSSPEESWSLRIMTRAAALTLISLLKSQGSGTVDHFSRAMVLIAEESANPRLSTTEVANQLGVSVRTLTRAFAANCTAVLREIQTARVEQLLKLLEDDPQITVNALVMRSGFQSVSSLHRALRAVIGIPLKDLRSSPSMYRSAVRRTPAEQSQTRLA